MAVNLIESVNGPVDLGCHINLNGTTQRRDLLYFGESQSRVIISCSSDNLKQVLSIAQKNKIDAAQIGIVTNDRRLRMDTCIDIDTKTAINAYSKSIEKKMPIE